MKITVKENPRIEKLLAELEASPQKRGAVITRSFNEGIYEFFETILGPYESGGIPVWSGVAKSSFLWISHFYGVPIDWDSDPALPYIPGRRGPTRSNIGDMSVPQNDDRWEGSRGNWRWILEINDPWYLEANEFLGPTPVQAQINRPWGIFESARKKTITKINRLVVHRLGESVRAASGATTNG